MLKVREARLNSTKNAVAIKTAIVRAKVLLLGDGNRRNASHNPKEEKNSSRHPAERKCTRTSEGSARTTLPICGGKLLAKRDRNGQGSAVAASPHGCGSRPDPQGTRLES